MENKIISPCISICRTDPVQVMLWLCKNMMKNWKDENTSEEWKIKNLDELISRMKGWQLETLKVLRS